MVVKVLSFILTLSVDNHRSCTSPFARMHNCNDVVFPYC